VRGSFAAFPLVNLAPFYVIPAKPVPAKAGSRNLPGNGAARSYELPATNYEPVLGLQFPSPCLLTLSSLKEHERPKDLPFTRFNKYYNKEKKSLKN